MWLTFRLCLKGSSQNHNDLALSLSFMSIQLTSLLNSLQMYLWYRGSKQTTMSKSVCCCWHYDGALLPHSKKALRLQPFLCGVLGGLGISPTIKTSMCNSWILRSVHFTKALATIWSWSLGAVQYVGLSSEMGYLQRSSFTQLYTVWLCDKIKILHKLTHNKAGWKANCHRDGGDATSV